MKLNLYISFFLAALLVGCSTGNISYYADGNTATRRFESRLDKPGDNRNHYFQVTRDRMGRIVKVKHYGPQKQLLDMNTYKYNNKGHLVKRQQKTFFKNGPSSSTIEWTYLNGKITAKEEKWFSRSRMLEKRLTTQYDNDGKPYLEETWVLGRKLESSTEFYYDYKKRLDKSRRNFYNTDGSLRDYWITIYNDQILILSEEHYLADNSLLAFYRYTYHPVHQYREQEEVFEELHQQFVTRTFNRKGLLLKEERRDHEMQLLGWVTYEYDKQDRPKREHHYSATGKLISSKKYKEPKYYQEFRTPGLSHWR